MNRSLFLILLVLSLLASCQKKKYPPQLSSVSPSSAPIGADITLTGTRFGDAPTVMMGSATVPTKTHTDNSISLTVPRTATGPTTVRVQNGDGTSDPLPFTVLQPLPQLSNVEPANGLPGTVVKLTGDFLDKLKAVRFGTSQAETTGSPTEKEVSVKVPQMSRGPVKLIIETEGGQGQTDFIVAALPQITGFSPRRVIVGTEITLLGKYLLDGIVQINGLTVDKARTSVQDEQIKFTVPPAATSGKITVTVFDKLVATTPDSLVVIPPPVLSDFTPKSGARGSEVTITGQQLGAVTEVKFSGGQSSAAQILEKNGGSLRVRVPDNAVTGTICLNSEGGQRCTGSNYTINLPPSITSLSPARGVVGTEVTISGSNLSEVQEVKFGNQTAQVKAGSDNSKVVVNCPDFASVQTVPVTVRTSGGVSYSLSFAGAPPPSIDKNRCVPTIVVPGWPLVIKGSNFNNITQVRFSNGSINRDQFINVDNGNNEITVRVPNNTQSGLVQLVNDYGAGQGIEFIKSPTGSIFTPDNIATNVGVITTGSISDLCNVLVFGYCMNGSCLIYTFSSQYADGKNECNSCDKNQPCFQTCEDCRNRNKYESTTINGSKYHVFKPYNLTPQTSELKFQRTPNDNAYSGFVIFIKDGVTYMGNMISKDGSLALKSVSTGADLRLCKVLPKSGTNNFLINALSDFTKPCQYIQCDDCK